MTTKEFKERVAESANHEWLLNFSVILDYPHINFRNVFVGVISLYEFIVNQIKGYDSFSSLPPDFIDIKKIFEEVRQNVVHLLTSNNISPHQWENNLRVLTNKNSLIFLHDSPETEFLIQIHEEYPICYRGAYEYISGSTTNTNNKNHLQGYLMAYEFMSKDFSLLVERKDAEKKSISKIRSEFQKTLADSEAHVTEYLQRANQKYIDYSGNIDQFRSEKESSYTGWFETTSSAIKEFQTVSDEKIKELENLYREKLKLEAPAKYWSDRAKQLKSEGYKWLVGLIIAITVGIIVLIWSLSEISNGTLEKIFENNGTAIKWSVVFITLISFIAFAIRTFSKLTFSSFHLVRDAEEREQLTYVYLALQKEKSIDQTERHLIMQSLFSRADTGLLKDDASPRMPGNIADKIISK